MAKVKLDEDIRPLSEFRANVSSYIQRIRETKRPMVLTQRGRSTAVLLDVSEYEHLREEIGVLRDIDRASKEINEGKGIPHGRAAKEILSEIPK